jgi:O-antigen ligase
VQRALLISLVAFSYLLFAGGPPWTLGPLLLLAVLGVLAAPRRTLRFPESWRGLDATLAVIVLGILAQLIPLPRAVLAMVSPHTLEVRRALRFSSLGAPEPRWAAVTLDPAATAYALGTVVLGILSFWIARALFAAGGSSRKFCRALAVFGAAAALAAMVQKAVAPTLVLGIMQPEARSANPLGAFTNRNHFAAWLLMISTVACGYLIAHMRIHPAYQQRGRAFLKQFLSSGALPTVTAAMITVGVLFLTLSRSAVAGLGAAGIAGWRIGRPRMQMERTKLPTLFGAAGAAILMFVMFIDVDGWAARFEQSLAPGAAGFSRTGIWSETVPIIADFPLAGTGAGTYSDAMTQYQKTRYWVGSMQRWAHFNNAHSHYVQVAAEGGLLLTVPVLFALVWLWRLGRRALRGDRGEMFWARVGAAAGLVGLAVQSIWEVALTMPANAVLCGVLAGLLIYKRDPSAAYKQEPYVPAASSLRPAARPRMV